ncbi:MAG TPA: hypothetical protein VM840_01250 [Actinomycetota bacterium]|nr:hypothetical protein [Actinomycetota bacterium]
MTGSYRLYGCLVRSALPLVAPHAEPGWTGDRRIKLSCRPHRHDEDRNGTVIAEVGSPAAFSVSRQDGDHFIRFSDVAGFHVGRDDDVTAYLPEGTSEGLAAVLFTGTVMSFMLAQHDPVLHASAVRVRGRTVALVASSGGGKSTTAAALCERGAELVTDDVLRVSVGGAQVLCHPGPAEIRLRPNALRYLPALSADSAPSTADGRVSYRRSPVAEPVPLDTIVYLRLSRETEGLRYRPLSPADAVVTLLRIPRVLGIRDPGMLTSQLDQLAAVCDATPMYEVTLPWGDLHRDDHLDELAALVEDGFHGSQ